MRGFVDWMVDILNSKTKFSGSVVIVKPTERGDYQELKAQDGLFHVVLDGVKDGSQISQVDLVASVTRTIHSYREWDKFLATARDPGFRYIVSNTTEAGIAFSKSDSFDHSPPEEFPGKLTRWLYERYQYFGGSINRGCLILPCELIENNGEALKETVLQYASHWNLDSRFEKWIVKHNYFYNTLVDRIVSGYPSARAEELKRTTKYEDQLMVAGEYYHSWVISGNPIIRRELPFRDTGLNVQFVDDISDYRELKVRVLNGAHTSLVPVGYLAGKETVDECMTNHRIEYYLKALLTEEVKPTLVNLTKTEIDLFIRDVLDRFRNPVLAHQLLDISLNSFSKFQARLKPTLIDYIRLKGEVPRKILFALASLIVFYRGKFQDEKIPLRDDSKVIDFARQTWTACEEEKIGLITLVSQFLSKLGIDRKIELFDDIQEVVTGFILDILEEGVERSLPG